MRSVIAILGVIVVAIVMAAFLHRAVSVISPSPTPGPGGPAVLVGAGDIGNCRTTTDEATAKLLDGIPGTVFTAGDNAYSDGTSANFTECYAPTWGRHRAPPVPLRAITTTTDRRTAMSIQSHVMAQSPLSRIAAPIAILAGALVMVTRPVILLTTPTDLGSFTAYLLGATHAVNGLVSIVAFALLLLALVAAYDRIARPAGALGVIGLGAAIIGTVFMTGDWWYEAFAVPRIAEVAPEVIETFVGGRLLIGGLLSFALFGIGWVLFGIASIRAHVFPRAISIAILVGGLLSGVPINFVYLPGGVILGLAFIWLGVWMLRTTDATSGAGEPALI